jgi:hypothetical protein
MYKYIFDITKKSTVKIICGRMHISELLMHVLNFFDDPSIHPQKLFFD